MIPNQRPMTVKQGLHGRTSTAQWASDQVGRIERMSGTQPIYQEKQKKEGVNPTPQQMNSTLGLAARAASL